MCGFGVFILRVKNVQQANDSRNRTYGANVSTMRSASGNDEILTGVSDIESVFVWGRCGLSTKDKKRSCQNVQIEPLVECFFKNEWVSIISTWLL